MPVQAMLVAEAAQRWGVAAGEINVVAGRLEHASGRTAGFGELAEAAGRRAVIRDAPLKPASAFKLIGQPLHRLDTGDPQFEAFGFEQRDVVEDLVEFLAIQARLAVDEIASATQRRRSPALR
jgi:isoquinoline 1-oxidoreductase beta subunit